jgi:hypothetical protein
MPRSRSSWLTLPAAIHHGEGAHVKVMPSCVAQEGASNAAMTCVRTFRHNGDEAAPTVSTRRTMAGANGHSCVAKHFFAIPTYT